MKPLPIRVSSHSGMRADEHPRMVTVGDEEHRVIRLLSGSIEESHDSKQMVRRYTVLTDRHVTMEILHAADGLWYLLAISPALGR